jgi:IclR family acetate operon transcriptional repressor
MPKSPDAPEANRILGLLVRILRDRGQIPLLRQAESLDLPLSTAYRLASHLSQAGLIRRISRGRFAQGLELAKLTGGIEPVPLLVQIARPHLKRLARRLRLTVHLGVMEEEMVTYLVKEHGGGAELFTRAGTQLDAYCSAIGKVMLAALPAAELDQYLSAGPLVALTSNTVTRPDELKNALAAIRSDGYAIDAEEVFENLRCVAVPIHDRGGHVIASVSVSRLVSAGPAVDEEPILAALRECARRVMGEL